MSIYLCPALMDLLVFLILFAVMYGAGERHMSSGQCAWLGAIFQVTYMLFSLVAGSLLHRRNARGFLLASTGLFSVTGILSLAFKTFLPLFVSLAILGMVMAFFFNAFQAFMRGETLPGSLTRSVGLYTLAWSLGGALGVFASGYAYRFGLAALGALTGLASLGIIGILLRHRARPAAPGLGEEAVLDRSAARPVSPRYVWIGWLVMFTVVFVQRPIQTFYPSLSAGAGLGAFVVGIPLAVHMALQGATGLALSPLKNLLYRKTSFVVFQAAAAALLFGVWLRPSLPACMAGIGLLGIYTGFAFYAAVFYASNSGRSAFNIGVNECLVGLGSVAGLFAVEAWMQWRNDPAAMYLVGALALLLSLALQLLVARRPGSRAKGKKPV